MVVAALVGGSIPLGSTIFLCVRPSESGGGVGAKKLMTNELRSFPYN